MLIPLILLAIGSIFSGYFFKEILIGDDRINFCNNSILLLYSTEHNHPPLWLLLITPLLVVSSNPIAYYLFVHNKEILKSFVLKFLLL